MDMSDHDMKAASVALDAVPKSYADAVQVLAAAHADGQDSIDIYCLPDAQERVVRLIEVSDSFPHGAVERRLATGGLERVVPVFSMGPARDFPFRSEIVQITPAEWDQLRQGTLQLNRNWGGLGAAQRIVHGQ